MPGRSRRLAWTALPAGCRTCRYLWRIGIVDTRCHACSRNLVERRAHPTIKVGDVYGHEVPIA